MLTSGYDTIETRNHKGLKLCVVPDYEPFSPREDDNFGTMVCWHKHYELGDKQLNSREEIDNFIASIPKDALVIPIMAYEHGGITIRGYDFGNWPDQQWDCFQVGLIYVTREKIREEFGLKKVNKSAIERARKMLEAEIEAYDDYLVGSIVGYVVFDEDKDVVVDSCYGYYDAEEAMKDATASADYYRMEQDASKWEKFSTQEAVKITTKELDSER